MKRPFSELSAKYDGATAVSFGALAGMKGVFARFMLAVLPIYFQRFPIQRGKTFVWKAVVVRHLLRRRLQLQTTSRFGGRFDVHFPDLVQTYLYFFGVWEPVITKYMFDVLRDGDIFIDVGANVGYYTLLASRLVGPRGKVFAIEAASVTYGRLLQTIAANHVQNVTAHHVAVSDTPGQIPVWINRDGNLAGSTTLAHVAERRSAMSVFETVEAKTLEQIIDPETIRNARIIKIDVEGAEWAVIKSLGELLTTVSSRTQFLVEVNEELVKRSGGTVEALLGYFTAAGFEPSLIENRYDVNFMVRRVDRVKLTGLGQRRARQFDLVFRKPDGSANASQIESAAG